VGELALSHDDRISIVYVRQDLPADGSDGRLKPQGQQKEREGDDLHVQTTDDMDEVDVSDCHFCICY
jgi:hypothetical protein